MPRSRPSGAAADSEPRSRKGAATRARLIEGGEAGVRGRRASSTRGSRTSASAQGSLTGPSITTSTRRRRSSARWRRHRSAPSPIGRGRTANALPTGRPTARPTASRSGAPIGAISTTTGRKSRIHGADRAGLSIRRSRARRSGPRPNDTSPIGPSDESFGSRRKGSPTRASIPRSRRRRSARWWRASPSCGSCRAMPSTISMRPSSSSRSSGAMRSGFAKTRPTECPDAGFSSPGHAGWSDARLAAEMLECIATARRT